MATVWRWESCNEENHEPDELVSFQPHPMPHTSTVFTVVVDVPDGSPNR